MPAEVIMPRLGESVDEGVVTRWLKAPGDWVKEFEPLLEVNTDKVDTEIPSPASGVLLEVRVPTGTTVRVGTLLALIGEPGDGAVGGEEPPVESLQAQAPAAPPMPGPPGAAPLKKARPAGGGGFISPLAARLAAEHGLDLAKIPGSGLGGRVTKHDVLDYLERAQASSAPAALDRSPFGQAPAAETGLLSELQPLSPMRRAIAEHMALSRRTSPHVVTFMEADMSRVTAHMQAHMAEFAGDGVRLTLTAYFIAAAAAGLKAVPLVNSSWGEGGVLLHRRINIGMAVALGEEGLIVPVIKDADGLSLLGLARAVNDLAARARARQLRPDEVKGGTFTLTNHGVGGSLFATPILHQPQCAILGVGALQKRVVVINSPGGEDAIAIRPMVYLGLTFDHRILDGASADRFLAKVVESLQNWA